MIRAIRVAQPRVPAFRFPRDQASLGKSSRRTKILMVSSTKITKKGEVWLRCGIEDFLCLFAFFVANSFLI
jgi:hypothetical protein